MALRAIAILSLLGYLAWMICGRIAGPDQLAHAQLEDDCAAYVRKATIAIIQDWRYDEWEKRATPELRMSTDLALRRRQFQAYKKRLGRFWRMSEPQGSVEIVDVRGQLIPVGSYAIRFTYRSTIADVLVKSVQRGGGWKFQNFTVRPAITIPGLPEE